MGVGGVRRCICRYMSMNDEIVGKKIEEVNRRVGFSSFI